MPDGPYARRSARVLLLDGDDRLLLIKAHLNAADPALGYCWITPGGGVAEGEPLPTAAARELGEEIGLSVWPADLGEPIATASGFADLGWAKGQFRDDFFVYRVGSHTVNTDGITSLEQDHFIEHRWWTLDELAASDETIYPYGLAALLRDLLAGRVPPEPVRLPWHH